MAYILMTSGSSSESRWKSWAEGTDEEIAEMLRMHYDGIINLHSFWKIGDERQVEISAISSDGVRAAQPKQTVSLVLMNKGGYINNEGQECAFVIGQKEPLINATEYDEFTEEGLNVDYSLWNATTMRNWCNQTYKNHLPASFSELLQSCSHYWSWTNQHGGSYWEMTLVGTDRISDQVFLPQMFEYGYYSCDICSIDDQVKQKYRTFDYYQTSSNRIRHNDGTVVSYWTGTCAGTTERVIMGNSWDKNNLLTVDQNQRINVQSPNSNNIYLVPHMFI